MFFFPFSASDPHYSLADPAPILAETARVGRWEKCVLSPFFLKPAWMLLIYVLRWSKVGQSKRFTPAENPAAGDNSLRPHPF